MNDSERPTPDHHLCLCLGSNIRPEENIPRALALLRTRAKVLRISTCWESAAVGSSGPSFWNVGVCALTPMDALAYKQQVVASIEGALGRVRSADKYAPRTIDLDVVLMDGQVLDHDIWQRAYLATIFAELHPELRHPQTEVSIRNVAEQLRQGSPLVERPGVLPAD